MGMDISKVDKKGRMVYGWATIDNVDTQGDVVTADASLDAFARSRKNLREMHKKDSAVGRIVSFKEDDFIAPDGKQYRGIFVKVRVSEGAPDTWAKVLDGTLNGFSIGGEIVESEEEFNKDAKQKVRVVKKYDLTELSLVDNPGNQFSDFTNIFKIRKSADGSVTAVSGMVENHQILNVHYCENDEITQEKPDDLVACPVCDEPMKVIGFVENGGDRVEKVKALITKFVGGGGENMPDDTQDVEEVEATNETEETGHEAGDPTEVPTPAVPAEEAEVDEVEDAEDKISKQIDSLKSTVTEHLEKSASETKKELGELRKAIDQAAAEFNTKATEFEKKLTELDENLGLTKSRLENAETKLEKVSSRSALKKSADSVTVSSVEEDDPWEGSALSQFTVRKLF